MATNLIQDGMVLTLTAPTGGVTSGGPVLIGALFVVALNTAEAAAPFQGATTGVWNLTKVAAQAWTEGAAIYWDNTAGNCTTIATNNTLIGHAAKAAATPSTAGLVRLRA